MQIPFQPAYTKGVTVTPNTTTDFVDFGPNTSESVVLTNFGENVCYIRVGDILDTIEASTADYPVMPGSQVSIGKTLDHQRIAFISPAGAGSLHIILGRGL